MEAVIALAKQKAGVIVSEGVDLVAQEFKLMPDETEDQAADRLLFAFVAELQK